MDPKPDSNKTKGTKTKGNEASQDKSTDKNTNTNPSTSTSKETNTNVLKELVRSYPAVQLDRYVCSMYYVSVYVCHFLNIN